MIWELNELVILLISFALFAIAVHLGFTLGHAKKQEDAESISHITSLQSALLGLLALLLGFTFAMSASRFDTRKQLVVEEANAIGTTYLRAQFLPEPQRSETRNMLKEYVTVRLDFYTAGTDSTLLKKAEDASSQLKQKLWNLTVPLGTRYERSDVFGLYIASLNEMIDLGEKRLAAFENRVPEVVVLLLFTVSLFGMAFIGYSNGVARERHRTPTILFALLTAIVLTIILDIDRPRRGLIQVSQASLIRLQQQL